MKGAKIYCLLVALAGWFTLLSQLYLSIHNRTESITETVIRYFTFFTILTNLLVTIMFSLELLKPPAAKGWRSYAGKTAMLSYILVVGVLYNAVLRQTWSPTGLQRMVDEMLHVVMPLLMLGYWLFFVQKQWLSWAVIPRWLLYPALYLLIVLLRGSIANDYYPYPFLQVKKLGFGMVMLNSLFVLLLFLLFMLLPVFASRKLGRRGE